MSGTFTCAGECATRYKREEAAFEWIGGEQVFTDICWRCYDKDKPVVRPKQRAYDDMHSSWGSHRGSASTAHFKTRH